MPEDVSVAQNLLETLEACEYVPPEHFHVVEPT